MAMAERHLGLLLLEVVVARLSMVACSRSVTESVVASRAAPLRSAPSSPAAPRLTADEQPILKFST
jgi:hypothetical protein